MSQPSLTRSSAPGSAKLLGDTLSAWVVPAAFTLAAALFTSGAAGLVNQVVWQRALKVFLGGSETLSAMVVVLVFMAGLGIGSIWMGRRAAGLRDPLRTFALLEGLLFAANLGVCALLASDLGDSVFAVQLIALRVGVPTLLLYAVGATLVLMVPCLLMGATMPLAAEVCQRRLQLTDSRVLGWLFFINTFGSVLGTIVASGHLIPHWGLTASLQAAAALNLVGAMILLGLGLAVSAPAAARPADKPAEPAASPAPLESWRAWFAKPTATDILALGLGFCSLGYEMYLFRIVAWRHQPLPFTFAGVLAGFLLYWSIGAAVSARWNFAIPKALRVCAFAVCFSIPMFAVDAERPITGTLGLAAFLITGLPYFAPCLCFGYLFSRVAAQAARSWGRDVGRIYAYNTLGSCLGVIIMTLVGYEMPFFMMVLLLALLLYALQELATAAGPTLSARRWGWRWVGPVLAGLATVVASFTLDLSRVTRNFRIFYGRDGMIAVDDEGNLMWDGLWHSKLSADNDHVGTNNWYLAVCPVLCHTGPIDDACVIGVATGITASTLSRLDTVQRIDGYDITHTLEEIFAEYPAGTLHLADNPKINLIWQDARSGLALRPDRRYDLIQTQPLYLKQGGSALLNSVGFYELIRDRLKPNGVFCLYSNGTAAQAFAVRQTAARVFAHGVSFLDGYLLVLSNDPIDLSTNTLARRLSQDDPLWREIRTFSRTQSPEAIHTLLDMPPLDWGDGRLTITDDRPIVEYPALLSETISAQGLATDLPAPTTVLAGD